MIIRNLRKVVTGFVFTILLFSVLIPNTVLALNSSKLKVDFLNVIDTVAGLNTYYKLSDKLDLSRVKLVLMDENKNTKIISNVKSNGSIDMDFIKNPGKYSLFTAFKTDSGKFKVIERDDFKVTKPVANLNVGLASYDDVYLSQSTSDRFRFKDVPTSVGMFDNFTMTVEALNTAGDLNSSYTGTIVFESSDPNAQLPDDYTFLSSDSGVKKFENAFYLSEVGTKEITVKDKNSNDLIGKVSVNVVASGSNNSDSANNAGIMQVTSPVAGVVTQNTVLFSGKVDPGLEVEILDKGIFLAKTNASATGDFSYTSAVLPDGAHEFVLKTNKATSSPIAVTINTASLNVSSVNLNPLKPVSGQSVELTVNLNTAASNVSAVINGVKTELQAVGSDKKVFRGNITAPVEPNSYPVNLDITSDLGVRSEVQAASTLEVLLGSAETGGLQGGITFNVPSQVLGLQAIPQDKRITLRWQPSTDDTGISNYKIFYGTNISDLSNVVETIDDSTSWFVPNLQNGVRYFFKVFGVDTEGNQGDQGSVIISAIPGVEGSTTLHGSGEDQVMVNATAETGPEVLFVVGFSLIMAYLIRRRLVF